MPCSAILTGHRLYTRPGTPEVPGLGPPRRVALGDIFGGEVPLVGVEAELAACGGLRKMGKEKRGRGRMGSAHVETASSRFGLPVGRASAPTAGSDVFQVGTHEWAGHAHSLQEGAAAPRAG